MQVRKTSGFQWNGVVSFYGLGPGVAVVEGEAATSNQRAAGSAMNKSLVIAPAPHVIEEIAAGNWRSLFIDLNIEVTEGGLYLHNRACCYCATKDDGQ